MEGARSAEDGSGEAPKVLYVMGAGRSGSTILGITLGNCEGVFYGGELDKWLRRSGEPPLGGEERERFWQQVRDQLEIAPELAGKRARCLEQSSAAFHVRDWPAQRRLGGPYRYFSRALYRTIARTAGASHIVDTSHFPRRARQLQKTDGIELHLLFVVRDAQSVVASWKRDDVIEPQFSVPTTNAYLWVTYLLSLLVFLRQPRRRRLLVRHEDFVADPAGVVSDILTRSAGASTMPDFTALRTGIPFQGNRVARSDVVALSKHASRPEQRSLLTAILQAPWRLVFALLRPVAGHARGAGPQPTAQQPVGQRA